MKKIRIGWQLFSVVGILVFGFSVVLFYQISTSSKNIYDQKYDMQRIMAESALSVLKFYHAKEVKGELDTKQAKALAFDAISAMRYNPDGYVFAYDYSGTRLAYPDQVGVGKNYINTADKFGTRLIADLIDVGRKGGGWTKYYWTRPTQPPEMVFPKVGYGLAFEPWGVMVGTGAYLDDLQEYVQSGTNKVLVAAAVVLIFSLAIAFWLIRGITGSLGRLRGALDEVANGNTSFEIPHADMSNEVGMMAKATKELQEKVRERQAMAAREQQQQQALDLERQNNADIQAQEARKQAHVVATIGASLEKLTTGDLTVRCADLGTEYESLRQNFNNAISGLEQAMGRVSLKGNDIAVSKEEIRRASGDLAQRTERQAANLEETSAALDELTVAIRQTADGAKEAANRVQSVSKEAQQSDGIVEHAIEAMSGIEKSSEEITKIIGVIDEIAFQTNLLALNAGVEAARAGESGKGFAVVAQEVRELAQRSAAAAKEIKDQIARSSAQVNEGVQLVGKTGEALKRISNQITEANEVVARIAASAAEQDTTIRSISSALNQLDTATQQNAAMAEETTASAEVLANDTGDLLELIQGFKVSGQSGQLHGMAQQMRRAS
ncbi:methyl-accepting chemotaxis protein [Agrobacterium vitis]|nr:methyl-accepting chemotaxis protein [Agrobacterium vitis]